MNRHEKNEDGVVTLPYPVYSEELIKFIDVFYKSGLSVDNYQDELNMGTSGLLDPKLKSSNKFYQCNLVIL
ncbi:MAG: hypothetical protein FWH17_06375 [Oscillospiraceae bacterium]|nr:hypothetical protein [Oscillospiraceae bacterium]